VVRKSQLTPCTVLSSRLDSYHRYRELEFGPWSACEGTEFTGVRHSRAKAPRVLLSNRRNGAFSAPPKSSERHCLPMNVYRTTGSFTRRAGPDHGMLSGIETANPICRERLHRDRTDYDRLSPSFRIIVFHPRGPYDHYAGEDTPGSPRGNSPHERTTTAFEALQHALKVLNPLLQDNGWIRWNMIATK
jgi:hypothetical protein